MTPLYIGVDGGGTKTEAIVTNAAGDVLARAQDGPSRYQIVGIETAVASVRGAVTKALAAAGAADALPAAACFGLSGAGRPTDVALWTAHLAPLAARIRVVHDGAAALAGALGGRPGVIVIAGTGSLAYGESPTGEPVRAGGNGWLIDDLGSAFDIGRRAVSAITRAHDGRAPATALTEPLLAHWGLSNVPEIITLLYGPAFERGELAALAPLVATVAQQGDPVALAIWEQAGHHLAEMAAAVVQQLGMPMAPVALIGSLWHAGALIREPFARHMAAMAPDGSPCEPEADPAEGAALLARRIG